VTDLAIAPAAFSSLPAAFSILPDDLSILLAAFSTLLAAFSTFSADLLTASDFSDTFFTAFLVSLDFDADFSFLGAETDFSFLVDFAGFSSFLAFGFSYFLALSADLDFFSTSFFSLLPESLTDAGALLDFTLASFLASF
jgi:hypothetical protein